MRIVPLASGSSGNSTLIETDSTRLLVDAGLRCDELEERLARIDVASKSIDALFITHRHKDHIRGATEFAARNKARVYGVRCTVRVIGSEAQRLVRRIETRRWIEIGDLRLMAIPVVHDAPETCALLIEQGGIRFGYATDLGCARGDIAQLLTDCDGLLLEFNHDLEMLLQGDDPPHLKRRITSDAGHLSNADAAALLRELAHPGLREVVLAHLSLRNNTPELALAAAREALAGRAPAVPQVAWPGVPGPFLDLGGHRPG